MKEGNAYKNTYYNPDIKPNPHEYGSEQHIVEEQLKEAIKNEKEQEEGKNPKKANSTKGSNVTKASNETKKAEKSSDSLEKLKNITATLQANSETLASIGAKTPTTFETATKDIFYDL